MARGRDSAGRSSDANLAARGRPAGGRRRGRPPAPPRRRGGPAARTRRRGPRRRRAPATRRRGPALRSARGAGRHRRAMQVIAASLVLALTGGAAGLLLAYTLVRTIVTLGPATMPGLRDVHVDLRTSLFTVAASVAAALLAA